MQEIALESASYLLLAALGALVLTAWWALDPAARSQRLPLPRSRLISWYGIDVFAGFILLFLILPLVDQTLRKAGLYECLYPNDSEESPDKRTTLWSSTLGPPLVIGLVLLGLKQLRGTRLVELGLSRKRAAVIVGLGYVTWLVLTPLVLAIMHGAVSVVELGGGTPIEHPVAEVTKQSLRLIEWLLMFAGTIVLMPFVEELLFRGLMLPWQLRGGWQAQVTTGFCALFVAAVAGAGKTYNPAPALFVFAMLALLLPLPFVLLRHVSAEAPIAEDNPMQPGWIEQMLRCTGDRRAQPLLAVCTNGLFFASMHSPIWPSPVALLFLGIGLAWLRYRTSSLLGSLTVHALFNAVGAVMLVVRAPGE